MGFLNLFDKKPSEKAIEKQMRYAKEPYAQPEYRRAAMEQLLKWDTEAALDAVLQRLTSVVQSPHWDEEEKRWLMDEMITKGEAGKQALIRFIMKHNEVSYAIKALHKLTSKEEITQVLIEALQHRPPEDHRSSLGKTELIAALQEQEGQHVISALLPYLDDLHDDVQCITMDVLTTKKASEAYPRLVQIISDDTRSPRVLRHAAMLVHQLKLPIDPKQALTAEVAEDFAIKNGKLESLR